MQFYYEVMCLLERMRADEIRKNKVLKHELGEIIWKKRCKGLVAKCHDIFYQRGTVRLLNRVIRKIKKIAGNMELADDFKEEKEEVEETFQET